MLGIYENSVEVAELEKVAINGIEVRADLYPRLLREIKRGGAAASLLKRSLPEITKQISLGTLEKFIKGSIDSDDEIEKIEMILLGVYKNLCPGRDQRELEEEIIRIEG